MLMKNNRLNLLLTAAPLSLIGVTGLAQDAEEPKWSQSAGVGFTLTRGNSENVLFTANYDAAKEWARNEMTLGLSGGYGESDNVKNTEFINGFGQYNRLFGEDDRMFGFGRLEGLSDGVADIDYRFILSAGMGYYFMKDYQEKFTLSGDVGPGVVYEKIGGEEETYATVRFGEKFNWQISETARLWQKADFSPQIDQVENYVFTFEIGAEAALTEKMSLRTVLTDTYRSEPADGRKNNDLKLVTSINYKF